MYINVIRSMVCYFAIISDMMMLEHKWHSRYKAQVYSIKHEKCCWISLGILDGSVPSYKRFWFQVFFFSTNRACTTISFYYSPIHSLYSSSLQQYAIHYLPPPHSLSSCLSPFTSLLNNHFPKIYHNTIQIIICK